MTREEITGEPGFRKASLDDYPHLDLSFYTEITRSLEEKGFTLIEDVEDVEWNRKNPHQKTCLRILAGDEGNIQALCYQIKATGVLSISRVILPFETKYVDFETEFSDGYFIITTKNPFTARKPGIEVEVKPEASLDELLGIHRERVKAYLQENLSVRVWKTTNPGEILESRQRQHRLKKDRNAQKKLRRKPSRRSSPGLLAEICQHKAVIFKVMMIIIIGVYLGQAKVDRSLTEIRYVNQLTLEKYTAGYDTFKEKMTRPPRPVLLSFLLGLSTIVLFWIVYEGGRRGGEMLMARSMCKKRRAPPENPSPYDPSPYDPSPAILKKAARANITMKLIVFLMAAGIAGLIEVGAEINRFETGKRLTVETYLEAYDGIKKDVPRPPSYVGYILGQILLVVGPLAGLYELTGKTVESISLLRHHKKLPITTHLIFSLGWTALGFFGGSLIWMFSVVPHVRGMEQGLKLLLIFAGPVFIALLLKFVFNAVPAQCPQCGGKAYRKGYRPIKYICRSCDHVHKTKINIGR